MARLDWKPIICAIYRNTKGNVLNRWKQKYEQRETRNVEVAAAISLTPYNGELKQGIIMYWYDSMWKVSQ